MQRIMNISFVANGKSTSLTNKSMVAVNELLSEGWRVVNIVCANENLNGVIGGFVVLEKDESEPRVRLRK